MTNGALGLTPEQIAAGELYDAFEDGDEPTQAQRLYDAFEKLTADERQLLTSALAGQHPEHLGHLREPVVRELARVDFGKPRP